MIRAVGALCAGLAFGMGLALSGMINPGKVVAFLDVFGNWDPSLAFVMAGAIAVTAPGYRLVFRRKTPLAGGAFTLPTRTDLDRDLLAGAAVFGVGWGLAGFCPGPALAGLAFGAPETVAFVIAMLLGMAAARKTAQFLARTGGASQ